MKKSRKAPKPRGASKRTPSPKASTTSTDARSTWIQIKKNFVLPAYVREAMNRLSTSGHIAYVVGGSVRDFLIGRECKDHDIATSATPDELVELFPNSIQVGKAFGVVKIPVRSDVILEIASFRKDGEYKDFRHPVKIELSGPEEDAKRRDFTVNGLFYDAKSNRVLDYVGGLEDIRRKVIRTIGDPQARFREDALRLIRGVRFCSSLGFKLDAVTAKSIVRGSELITKVSAERIRDELNLIFSSTRPDHALKLLSETNLLRWVLPEVEAMKGVMQSPLYEGQMDLWQHKLKALAIFRKQNENPSPILSWAVVLHDIGKPEALKQSMGKNFNHHETIGAGLAKRICTRLKMSNYEIQSIVSLVQDYLKFREVFGMREATLQRWMREPYFEDVLALHRVDALTSDGNLAFYEFCKSKLEDISRSPKVFPLIAGKDLIHLGLKPGPRFSVILRVIEDLALEKKIKTKEEALEFVYQHFLSEE